MIYYDSQRACTLLRLTGSVLPRAMLWALPAALVASALKYLDQEGIISLDSLEVLTQGDVWSGYTYVLGFSLVFRTQQAYMRYWTAATSIHEMSTEWCDSCASLIAFTTNEPGFLQESLRFKHTTVRLFSLLHAMALSEIASISQELPLLDVQGLNKKHLHLLTSDHAQGRKVLIVMSWIKTYISHMAAKGIVIVPPPILTRVYQALGFGLVNFHKSQQIVIWPFPFPYTQMNFLLLGIYIIITPVVVSTWQTWSWMCFIFTFISVTCMVGLDLIGSELENPFGEDPNDMPVMELQIDMNKSLTLLLNPVMVSPPDLLPSANLDYKTLVSSTMTRMSLRQRLESSNSLASGTGRKSFIKKFSIGSRGDRLIAQRRWCGEPVPEHEITRLASWLHCIPDALSRAVQVASHFGTGSHDLAPMHPPPTLPTNMDFAATSPRLSAESGSPKVLTSYCSEIPEIIPEGRLSYMSCGSSPAMSMADRAQKTLTDRSAQPKQDWAELVHSLHEQLREHLDNQLTVQRQELVAFEDILLRLGQQCSHLMSGPLPRCQSLSQCTSQCQSMEKSIEKHLVHVSEDVEEIDGDAPEALPLDAADASSTDDEELPVELNASLPVKARKVELLRPAPVHKRERGFEHFSPNPRGWNLPDSQQEEFFEGTSG